MILFTVFRLVLLIIISKGRMLKSDAFNDFRSVRSEGMDNAEKFDW